MTADCGQCLQFTRDYYFLNFRGGGLGSGIAPAAQGSRDAGLPGQDRMGGFPGSVRVPCIPGPAVSEVFGRQSPALGNPRMMGAATWQSFPVPSETSVTPRSFAHPWGWSPSVPELMHFRIWLSFFCHREARLFFLVSLYAQIRQAGMSFPTLVCGKRTWFSMDADIRVVCKPGCLQF